MTDRSNEANTILHLIPTLEASGAENQLEYLSTELIRMGWTVHVSYLRPGSNAEPLRQAGTILHPIKHRSAYDLRIPLLIYSTIRAVRPAIVQTWLPMMDIAGGITSRIAGIPWILTERNTPPTRDVSLQFRLRFLLARFANAVVSNSRPADQRWSSKLPNRVLHSTIFNGIPFKRIQPAEAAKLSRFGLSDSKDLILYIGRLWKTQKNISNLLEAMRLTLEQSNAVALVCGSGPLEAETRQFIERHALSGRMAAPGFVSPPWSLLKRASVFVSLSCYEGMPNTVMEAMASACPLVVSDISAHRELVDSSSALLVPAGDPHAAAQAILATLENPQAARARASNALALAKQWSIEKMATDYQALYEAVVNNRELPPSDQRSLPSR
jgi:glycosyltransferase involved in cell wall biosynthesis